MNQSGRDASQFSLVESFTVFFFISSYLYISGFSTTLMNLILICLEFIILSFTPTLFNSVEEPIEGRYGDTLEQSPYTQQ